MSDGSYFVDHKRGEIMELKNALQDKKLDKDIKGKREVIKKVIAYMTLGIDVSSLFSQMVMATNTQDLIQKKMVYLYLCQYASTKPDLALLIIATLTKDCRDDDPMIRGLALRSLCSLRVNNLTEYILQPIRNGLKDTSSYVRKTAVIGVAKLYNINPSAIKDSDLIDILYNMIKDKDQLVVINSIHALNEILSDEGGIAVNVKIIHHLLNRLHTFNEWSQSTILEVVSRYKPSGKNAKDETFDIMNLLEDRLKHSNSSLVLGTIKIFLNLTNEMPKIQKDVYKRIKTPILTLISAPNHGIAYPIIAHALLISQKYPKIFYNEYKHFFCRFNDPLCIKETKVQILANIATNKNSKDIIIELSEYITDKYIEIVRLSIQSIGKIAVKIEPATEEAIYQLLNFLELNNDVIIAETFVCIKLLLRKYPSEYKEILNKLKGYMRMVDEPQGKCAILWLLGEYGHTFDEAPYILETFIDDYEYEKNESVRLQLITSTTQLFFKTPGEIHKMMSRLLYNAIKNTNQVNVRERALFIYKLLKYDINKAKNVCLNNNNDVASLSDAMNPDKMQTLFNQFNTLSVVYQKPAELFIGLEVYDDYDDEDEDDENDDNGEKKDDSKEVDKQDQDQPQKQQQSIEQSSQQINNGKQTQSQSQSQQKQKENVMDLLDFDNDGDNNNNNVPDEQSNNNNNNVNINLMDIPSCSSKMFQKLWKQIKITETINRKVVSSDLAKTIEQIAHNNKFKTAAGGVVKHMLKLYIYCQETSGNLHFIECIVNLNTLQLKATIKGQNNNYKLVTEYFQNILASVLA